MISIGKAVNYILSNNNNIKTYTGSRIYPVVAPDGTRLPLITFTRQNVIPQYTRDGVCGNKCPFQILIAADNYSDSIAIAEEVRKALELKSGEFAGVRIVNITLNSVGEDFGEDAFIQTLNFDITTK